MTARFRHKLKRWFTTVLNLAAGSAVAPLFYWFGRVAEWQQQTDGDGRLDFYAQFALSLDLYPVLFPLVLVWHLSDFVQRTSPVTGRLARFTRYRTFLALVLMDVVVFCCLGLRMIEQNTCDALPGAQFYQCLIRPPPALVMLFLLLLAATAILSLIKALTAGLSLVRRDTARPDPLSPLPKSR